MSKYYKWKLSQWKRGEIEPVGWRKCGWSGCRKDFPIFSEKSQQKCCCEEHSELFRKERLAESKQSFTVVKDRKRKADVPNDCFKPEGDCKHYDKGFDIDSVDEGCFGITMFKKDGSCYEPP